MEFKYTLGTFLSRIQNATEAERVEAIDQWFNYASSTKESFKSIGELAEKFFNDPNSPYRDEKNAIHVLEILSGSSLLSSELKESYSKKLDRALLNCAGSKANNFSVRLPNGDAKQLYDIESELTVLYLYNPDCPACAEISGELLNSEEFASLVKRGEVTVFAVYVEGEKEKWPAFMNKSPQWIHAWDKENLIEKNNIYDLRAIPTIYLLNKDKEVIFKDCTPRQLFRYLGF